MAQEQTNQPPNGLQRVTSDNATVPAKGLVWARWLCRSIHVPNHGNGFEL